MVSNSFRPAVSIIIAFVKAPDESKKENPERSPALSIPERSKRKDSGKTAGIEIETKD
jgi:hypothetical protein